MDKSEARAIWVAWFVSMLVLGPLAIMVGTDMLHNGLPGVPELGYAQSVIVSVMLRIGAGK